MVFYVGNKKIISPQGFSLSYSEQLPREVKKKKKDYYIF